MSNYYDISLKDNWKSVEVVNKGWSEDKKFYVVTKDNEELLLRICDISKYEKKKKEFEYMKLLEDKDILMCKPITIGKFNNNKNIFLLYTWINGEDAIDKIITLPKKEQYNLGIVAGKYLKEIHSVPAPIECEEWSCKFNKKIDKKILSYRMCGVILENSDKMIKYIEDNRDLLKNRPQCFQHGDYHIGNMIISDENKIGIIDFNRFDFGDPWEEFNRIVWSAQTSYEFASGCINGYFDNKVPDLFFRLMLLYILNNQLASIPWAQSFGEKELESAVNQANDVSKWYSNYETYIPKWYIDNVNSI